MNESSRYRTAGAVYLVVGLAVMTITVMTPEMASAERRADLIHLAIGLPFFGLFALAIAYGDRAVAWLLRALRMAPEKAAHVGRWTREKLVMLLCLSALGRTFVFAASGLGWKPAIGWRPLALAMEVVPATPRMLINAVLMAIILIFLVRASWVPFVRRFRSPEQMVGQAPPCETPAPD